MQLHLGFIPASNYIICEFVTSVTFVTCREMRNAGFSIFDFRHFLSEFLNFVLNFRVGCDRQSADQCERETTVALQLVSHHYVCALHYPFKLSNRHYLIQRRKLFILHSDS